MPALFQRFRQAARRLPGLVLGGLWEGLLDPVYPPHCLLCRSGVEGKNKLCGPCLREVFPIRAPRCEKCSDPLETGAVTAAKEAGSIAAPLCPHCRERRRHFTHAVACYQSRGSVRELILAFKYEGRRHLHHALADFLAPALDDPRLAHPPCELLLPVPLHPRRRRERGFNQALLLARELSRRSGIPLVEPLARIRDTEQQTHFEREERLTNLRGAFVLKNPQNRDVRAIKGKHILLIDDVLTTGSTASECARVLKKGGAKSVRVATVARA